MHPATQPHQFKLHAQKHLQADGLNSKSLGLESLDHSGHYRVHPTRRLLTHRSLLVTFGCETKIIFLTILKENCCSLLNVSDPTNLALALTHNLIRAFEACRMSTVQISVLKTLLKFSDSCLDQCYMGDQ